MKGISVSKLRSYMSARYVTEKFSEPTWIVSGRNTEPLAAIIPAKQFHDLQTLLGQDLEYLPILLRDKKK
jgi:hypothetical protein